LRPPRRRSAPTSAQSYVNRLAGPDEPDADDDGLRALTCALPRSPPSRRYAKRVDTEALELTDKLFAEHRVAIKGLRDVRQQEYEDIPRDGEHDPQLGTLRPPHADRRGSPSRRTVRSPWRPSRRFT